MELAIKSKEILTHVKTEAGSGDTLYIVDLGCGDGKKVTKLAQNALDLYDNVEICVVDISQNILDAASANIEEKFSGSGKVKVSTVCSDIKSLAGNENYQSFIDSSDDNLLHTFLGTTYCNDDLCDTTELMHNLMGRFGLFGIYTFEPELYKEIIDNYRGEDGLSYQMLKNMDEQFPDYDPKMFEYNVKMLMEDYRRGDINYGILAKVITSFRLLEPISVGSEVHERGKVIEGAFSIKPTDQQVYRILGKHFDILQNHKSSNVHLYLAENREKVSGRG